MPKDMTRLFSMNMPRRLHRALKLEAAKRDVTMGEIVTQALKEWGLDPLEGEGLDDEEDSDRQ